MRYRLKLFLTLGLAALGLLTLTTGTWFAGGSAQAQAVVVRLDPPSQTVDVSSGDFTVNVVIDGVTNLGAYEFEVKFNPDVVSFVGVENGPFLGSTGRDLRCQIPRLEPSSPDGPVDTLHFACATNDPSPPAPAGPNGSGVLATVTFAPSGAGAGPLTLIATTHDTGTTDVGGNVIGVEAQSGTVTVAGAGPTATPKPNEPTAVPTRKYVPFVHATPDPSAASLLSSDPGEPQLTRPMPGNAMTIPNETSGTSGGGVSAVAGSSKGPSAGSTSAGSTSAGGAPRAGSGPPEDEAARWPMFAGGLLAAAGAGLLAFSIFLKHGLRRRDDTLGL